LHRPYDASYTTSASFSSSSSLGTTHKQTSSSFPISSPPLSLSANLSPFPPFSLPDRFFLKTMVSPLDLPFYCPFYFYTITYRPTPPSLGYLGDPPPILCSAAHSGALIIAVLRRPALYFLCTLSVQRTDTMGFYVVLFYIVSCPLSGRFPCQCITTKINSLISFLDRCMSVGVGRLMST